MWSRFPSGSDARDNTQLLSNRGSAVGTTDLGQRDTLAGISPYPSRILPPGPPAGKTPEASEALSRLPSVRTRRWRVGQKDPREAPRLRSMGQSRRSTQEVQRTKDALHAGWKPSVKRWRFAPTRRTRRTPIWCSSRSTAAVSQGHRRPDARQGVREAAPGFQHQPLGGAGLLHASTRLPLPWLTNRRTSLQWNYIMGHEVPT